MDLAKIRNKIFFWGLDFNIKETLNILHSDFAQVHPITPDLSTLLELLEGSNTPWRAAYFMVIIDVLKKTGYQGKIISADNYNFFLNYAEHYHINIHQEIKTLNNWKNEDYDQLLKHFVSLLIKISAIEIKTGIKFKIIVEFQREQ